MNIVESGEFVRTGRFAEKDGHKVEFVEGNTIRRIDCLNKSVKAMFQSFKLQADKELPVQMSVFTFGETVEQIMPLTDVQEVFSMPELHACGDTPLKEVLEQSKAMIEDRSQISSKDYKPCVVLVSDGEANPGWEDALETFITDGRSSKCDRWAVSISKDADKKMLSKFVLNEEQLLEADKADTIAECFKLITMSVLARTKTQNPNDLVPLSSSAQADSSVSEFMKEQEARIATLFQF
jgi:uncharacterized protein YegL